ncbi:MAG: TetR/AcrR family transcriptional regulator, partial [Actinomycetota bacterium]|nr:TetR/AcrR family transcriptional regulator [Actinomycetota bacterium]
LLREFVEQELIAPMSDSLAGEDARLRAGAVASQLLGLIYARYVLRLEPLASAEPESIVATLAPALERLLNPPTQAPPQSSGRR